jgi:hypothetical protein
MNTNLSNTKPGDKGCGNCNVHNGCVYMQHAYETPSCWEDNTSEEILLNQNTKQQLRFLNRATIHATHLPVHP